LSSDVITINDDGIYLIMARVNFTRASGTRGHVKVQVQKNTGGGWFGIGPDDGYGYWRDASGTSTANTFFIRSYSSGDQIRMIATTNANTVTTVYGSNLTVMRLFA